MIEVKIIRGYKLKLWRDRLRLAPEFVNQLDLVAKNYVHMEVPYEDDTLEVILFTKVKNQRLPIPVKISMSNEVAESLIERIEL